MKKIGDGVSSALLKTRMGKLVREIEILHTTTPLARWQRDRIAEVRVLCEKKEQAIIDKANQLCQQIREEHMQFEIDFIYSSMEFRKKNPDDEMHFEPQDGIGEKIKGFFNNLKVPYV